MKKIKKTEKGSTALIVVVVIGIVGLLLAKNMVFAGLNTLEQASLEQGRQEAFYLAEACLADILIKYRDTGVLSSGTNNLDIFSGSCSENISDEEDNKRIIITSQKDSYNQKLNILARYNSGVVAILDWQEY